MSKVFNAKRKEVTAQYEFLDGATSDMVIVSLSTGESNKLGELQKDEATTLGAFLEAQSRYFLQRNDKKITDRILKEQMNEGDILEFAKAVREAIDEAKKEKGNG
jgi:hypothetical protein